MEAIDNTLKAKAVEQGRLGWVEAFLVENLTEDFSELQAVSNVWDEEEWLWW